MLRALLDVVFPTRCAGCGSGPWPFCAACRAEIVVLRPPWCDRCGAPASETVERCRDCPPASITIARAPFGFDGPIRRAVHRLKFGGWRAVADALADPMSHLWIDTSWTPDGLTWVPLSRDRLATRGFDQAEALARVVGSRIGVPPRPMLRRVGNGGPQARRAGAARRRVMQQMFAATAEVSGRIVLVDDVLTTGATGGACASCLVAAGATEVGLLTAARAVSSARRRPLYSATGSRPGLWLPRGTVPRQSKPAAGEATHVSRPLVGEHGAV